MHLFISCVQLRLEQTHPYLKLAWNVTAGIYKVWHQCLLTLVDVLIAFKIVSRQIKLDKRVSDLLLSIAVSIAATGDIRDLELQSTQSSLDQAIRSLGDLLIKITILIREYLSHGFAGKVPLLCSSQLLMIDQRESATSSTEQR